MNQDYCFYTQKITSVNINDIMEMLGLKRSFVRTMITYDKSEYLVACVDNGAELTENRSKTNGTRSISLNVAYVGAESRNTLDCSSGPSRPEKLYNHTPILK